MFVEEKKLNSFNIYLEAKKDYTFRANLRKGKLHLWLKVF